jgi:hypothetical protein
MVKMERLIDFDLSVPDRPGELAKLAADLKKAQVGLRALWGFGIGGGQAEIICVPEDAGKFRAFADAAGLHYRERSVVCLTGEDRLGELVDTLEKIAGARLNVHALDAIAVDGRVVSYLWVDDADRDSLAKLLGV